MLLKPQGIELYLPNRKTLQDLYVPSEIELPKGDPRCQVFDFGGPGDPQAGINPFETRERVWVFDRAMLIWAITGTMVLSAAPGTVVAAGFRFQIFQATPTKNGVAQRAWFNKHQVQQNLAGTGQLPLLLRKTQPVAAGDAITIEVRSLVTPAAGQVTRIQLCLFGVLLDGVAQAPPPVQTSAPLTISG